MSLSRPHFRITGQEHLHVKPTGRNTRAWQPAGGCGKEAAGVDRPASAALGQLGSPDVAWRQRLSYWKMGPTELRILLAIGTLLLLRSDSVVIAGHRWLLFDVGCAVGAAGLAVTFITAAFGNARELYRREPLPPAPNIWRRSQIPSSKSQISIRGAITSE
jgi:hypothetical protein